jgi:hypothetical protein
MSKRVLLIIFRALSWGAVLALVAGVLIGLCRPYSTHAGLRTVRIPVTLEFEVLTSDQGIPVPNSRVALTHVYDPEEPVIEGVTDEKGLVKLHARFVQCTTEDRPGQIVYTRYDCWAVTVNATGYDNYCAFLGASRYLAGFLPDCSAALNLGYPFPVPIRLRIKPSSTLLGRTLGEGQS